MALGRLPWIQQDFVCVKTQMGLDRFEVDFFCTDFSIFKGLLRIWFEAK